MIGYAFRYATGIRYCRVFCFCQGKPNFQLHSHLNGSYFFRSSLRLLGISKHFSSMTWDVSTLRSKLPVVISQDLQHMKGSIITKCEQGTTLDPHMYNEPKQSDDYGSIGNCIVKKEGKAVSKRKSLCTVDTGNSKVIKMEDPVVHNMLKDELPFHDQIHVDDDGKNNDLIGRRHVGNVNKCNHNQNIYPSHCLMLKITDHSVVEKISALKAEIEMQHPDFASSYVLQQSLYLPFITMALSNSSDIQKISDELQSLVADIKHLTSTASKTFVEFQTLNHLQGKVLSINLKKDEGLNYFKRVRKLIQKSLLKLGINATQEQFKRGVTIMKLGDSFDLVRENSIDKIDPTVFGNYQDDYFGKQELNEIIFCSISNFKGDLLYNRLGCLNLINSKFLRTDNVFEENQIKDKLTGIPKNNYDKKRTISELDIIKSREERKLAKKRRKEESRQNFSPSENKTSGNDSKKSRPTHFLAFRIRNPVIHEKAMTLQKAIGDMNADYKPAFVAIPTLHVTLAVMTLSNQVEIDSAIKGLASSLTKLIDVYDKVACKFLEFDALNSFNGKVLFVDMRKTESLKLLYSMVPILKDALLQQNITVTNEAFKPHATVMKLSKGYKQLKRKGIKKIPEELYSKHKNEYFGEEELVEILLCSMMDKKNDDGFYKTLASLNLKNKVITGTDNRPIDISKLTSQDFDGSVLSSSIPSSGPSSSNNISIFPEVQEIDPNYPYFLYGNIFIRMCVDIYRIIIEYFFRFLH